MRLPKHKLRINHFELSRRYGSTVSPVAGRVSGGFGCAGLGSSYSSGLRSFERESKSGNVARKLLVSTFSRVHRGRSVDWLLSDPQLSKIFVEAVQRRATGLSEESILRTLLSIRKVPNSDFRLPPTTNRERMSSILRAAILPTVEIAVARTRYAHRSSIDDILVDPVVRSTFDSICRVLVPSGEALHWRLTALYIRKDLKRHATAKNAAIREEMDLRVVEKRISRFRSISDIKIDSVPEKSGFYVLRYPSRNNLYLYAGAAQSLRPSVGSLIRPAFWDRVGGGLWDLRSEGVEASYFQASKVDSLPIGLWTAKFVEDRKPLFNLTAGDDAA